MVRGFGISGLVLLVLVIGGRAEEKTDNKAPAKDKHPGLERIKSLAGTWVMADKDGKPTDKVVTVFKVTASGSAVQQTIFPGEDMEMLSIYHRDGADLIMTHYCALGNQPRMKADPKSPKNQLRFVFAGGTNFNPEKDMHMHSGTFTFVDDDHIEFSGECWCDGKECKDHECGFKLIRKK